MSEKTKLIIVSVEDSAISTKLQVATEDYNAMYEAVAYKQQYNKETETWEDSKDAIKKYNEALKLAGGAFVEDGTVEMYVDDKSGNAYFTPASGFIKPEKPALKLKRIKKAPIVQINDSAKGRAVIIEHDGHYYAFNFNTGVWLANKKRFIPNKAKIAKAKVRFNELFEDVSVNWDNAKEKAIGLVVDCTIAKNSLDPSSPFGYLEPAPLDPDDQPEKPVDDEVDNSIDITADELPF